MSVGHYENFPVASILLPARLRRPVATIYHFARSADDIADEGDADSATRLAGLDAYRVELASIERNEPAQSPLFASLDAVIRDHRLPLQAFYDLLDAFSQDVVKKRYTTFDELLDYCRRSANPVGLLMLHLYDAATSENIRRSDAICSALQLINFWQDIEVDLAKNRIYIPGEDLERFGVSEDQLMRGDAGGRFSELMLFEIDRARRMLESGAPLALALPGRIGLELRMIVQGGLRIAERLATLRGNVFRRRPVLRPYDWLVMASRAWRM